LGISSEWLTPATSMQSSRNQDTSFLRLTQHHSKLGTIILGDWHHHLWVHTLFRSHFPPVSTNTQIKTWRNETKYTKITGPFSPIRCKTCHNHWSGISYDCGSLLCFWTIQIILCSNSFFGQTWLYKEFCKNVTALLEYFNLFNCFCACTVTAYILVLPLQTTYAKTQPIIP